MDVKTMKKLFTIQQQNEQFELAKEAFLNGHYEESEAMLRLVVESAFQHNDYKTYVSAIIWLNRTLINTAQLNELYTLLLILNSLIKKYGTQEEYLFYRMQTVIFNNYYDIGDTMEQFEELFEEALQTEEYTAIFLIGSNMLLTYCEKNEVDKGIELYYRLKRLFEKYDSPNKMTHFMHTIYAFLLFYAKGDYKACGELMAYIDDNRNITVVDSFAYYAARFCTFKQVRSTAHESCLKTPFKQLQT